MVVYVENKNGNKKEQTVIFNEEFINKNDCEQGKLIANLVELTEQGKVVIKEVKSIFG